LAKVGRAELALGDAQAAAQVIAFSLVIVIELGLSWAEAGLWEQLAECLGLAADFDRSLTFLEEVTGIDRDATEAFLGALSQPGRTTPPAAPAA
jgi:hypothetical protein